MLGAEPLVDVLHNMFVKLYSFQGYEFELQLLCIEISLGLCCKICSICLADCIVCS